jgi:hypothetical protein
MNESSLSSCGTVFFFSFNEAQNFSIASDEATRSPQIIKEEHNMVELPLNVLPILVFCQSQKCPEFKKFLSLVFKVTAPQQNPKWALHYISYLHSYPLYLISKQHFKLQ